MLGDDVELPSPPQNFSINGLISEYSDISETFSVFEKDVMDQFETKFLDFSKSRFDIKTSPEDFAAIDGNGTVSNFTNFHEFFRVKSERNFEYWGQIACEICILKRLRQGGKLITCVKAEMKFVYHKFEFLRG